MPYGREVLKGAMCIDTSEREQRVESCYQAVWTRMSASAPPDSKQTVRPLPASPCLTAWLMARFTGR